MSAWQQIGRAGRGWNRDAFVLFYAMNDPIDRFFVGNLDAFLDKPFDELVVDIQNQQLIENHLRSLADETDGRVEPAKSYDMSNASIDKDQGIELGKHLLAIARQGADKIVRDGLLVPIG